MTAWESASARILDALDAAMDEVEDRHLIAREPAWAAWRDEGGEA